MKRIIFAAFLSGAWYFAPAQMAGPNPGHFAANPIMVKNKPALPSNPKVNRRTRELYASLQTLPQKGILFGHQDDLAYGIGWKYMPGESDVKRVAGDYPAVYGWDLGHLELGSKHNIDRVPFDTMRRFIRDGYRRGGVITLSWHLHNPATGGSSWDTAASVRQVLPGGEKHELFLSWLGRVADFLGSIRHKGKPVPVLFRPFHEHTGSWFWWGEKNCTAEEYIALWRMTADYLRVTRKMSNILLVYSAAEFTDEAHFLERYPGDEYVDVMGFDTYMRDPALEGSTGVFIERLRKSLDMLSRIAARHGKPFCLAETGLEQIPHTDWWTNTLWTAIKDYPIIYVLLWRNGRADHYYVPYPGHPSEADFKKFAGEQRLLLESDVRAADIYRTRNFWGKLLRR